MTRKFRCPFDLWYTAIDAKERIDIAIFTIKTCFLLKYCFKRDKYKQRIIEIRLDIPTPLHTMGSPVI